MVTSLHFDELLKPPSRSREEDIGVEFPGRD